MIATVETTWGTVQGEVISSGVIGVTAIRTIYGAVYTRSELDGIFRSE